MNINIVLDKTIKIDLQAALDFCAPIVGSMTDTVESWILQDRVSEKLEEYLGTLGETDGEYFYITEEGINDFFEEFKNFYSK